MEALRKDVMSRLTTKDFAPELLELYDFYAHGFIDRRKFLSRASRFAAGGLGAAALLLHYAGLDTRVNAGWPAYEAALKANGKTYEAHVYPGVNHGFHNDSTPRYDRAAAELAWSRSIAWFRRWLA
ncbi:dienelactone hydrolase family protein [Castellaniella sp. WN]